MDALSAIFPTLDNEILSAVLDSTDNNTEQAIEILLQMSADNPQSPSVLDCYLY
jgi:hypothetical protein